MELEIDDHVRTLAIATINGVPYECFVIEDGEETDVLRFFKNVPGALHPSGVYPNRVESLVKDLLDLFREMLQRDGIYRWEDLHSDLVVTRSHTLTRDLLERVLMWRVGQPRQSERAREEPVPA